MARVRKITTMAELQAALQAAFNAINRDFYNGELEKVIITVKEGRKEGVLGTFCTEKEWIQNGKPRHEINIAANHIGQRTVEETIITLMHEIVHLYNMQKGIQDTSRSGTYHNKEFKKTADAHGLIISKAPKIGWSVTTAKPQTAQWIKDNIPIKSFGVYKQTANSADGGKAKTKQSYRKYICPCCGLIVRATKDCNIACLDCGEQMEIES